MSVKIEVPNEEIAAFCRRHHIRKLAFFGSVLRDDFTPESDVDVLVEFKPEYTPGLAFFAMQRELSAILGRKVDMNTVQGLSPYFRFDILWTIIQSDLSHLIRHLETIIDDEA